MNGNDSDWLNDTVPEEKDNEQENITSTEVNNVDNPVDNKVLNESNDTISQKVNNDYQEDIRKEQPKTLSGIVQNINVEKSDDEVYLEEYMGKNYEKISTKLLNFGAFFFSYLYLFYRKMYLLGIIVLAIQTALILYVNQYVALVVNVILLFTTNIIYTGHAKRKIKKIKNSSGSKLKENLVNVCADKGGISKKAVFLGLVLTIGIFVFISFQFREKEPYMQVADFIDNKVEDIKYEIDNLISKD